ncbi:hypothetical protein AB0B44_27540, partial [Streptomyces sp. NPDC041003]
GPCRAAAARRAPRRGRRTEACWDRSVYPPLADAPLEVGETYTVPGERITIEVADRTRSGAYTVKITT